MRLTNVAQMDLVSGRVFSYAVQDALGRGRALPVSFDQGRHVGEGQRAGSWLAIAFRLPEPASRVPVAAAWDAVVARHGTLRTVFSVSDHGRLLLDEVVVSPGVWDEHPVAAGRRTREVLRDVFDAHCAPLERPSHRVCIVEPDDGSAPDLVIGADHAHVDMWSLVILARDLLTCLGDAQAGRVPGATLPPVPPFAEHTAELDHLHEAPVEVHARWASILEAGGGAMPTFPLSLRPRAP